MSTVTPVKKYTVTVHVAGPQRRSDNERSRAGHMWYSLSDGVGEAKSYGFGPKKPGDPFGPGKTTEKDNALGDGIETRGADGTVLFDHNGDGMRTGTGWVRSDDGLLVLDRNSNGTIDTGAELFGVHTVKADGTQATDGFDALSDLGNGNTQTASAATRSDDTTGTAVNLNLASNGFFRQFTNPVTLTD